MESLRVERLDHLGLIAAVIKDVRLIDMINTAIPAECLSVSGFWAVGPSIVLYGRSVCKQSESDSAFLSA